MSLAYDKAIKVVKCEDPIVRANAEREYVALLGGTRVTYKPFVSTSFSNSSFQFSTPAPSPHVYVDRMVHLKASFLVDLVGNDNGSPLLELNEFALRSYPLASIMSTISVTINNATASINMADVVDPLMRFNLCRDAKNTWHSTAPCFLDTTQQYFAAANTLRNPLAKGLDNDYQDPRGGFRVEVLQNTNTAARLRYTVSEPIFLSPLLFGDYEECGFIGVQNMSWNFTIGESSRIFTTSKDNITGVTVTFQGAGGVMPTLLVKYISPDSIQKIPKTVSFPYYDTQRYVTDLNESFPAATVDAIGAPRTVQSNNIQLQSVPQKMICFIRRKFGATPWVQPNAYLAITGISLNFNNNAGLLSSASQEDLYYMSVRNGLCMSWTQWSGGPIFNGTIPADGAVGLGKVGDVGLSCGPLAIAFGQDIGLESTMAPGVLGTFQLQYQITAQAVDVGAQSFNDYELVTIIISEGNISISENRAENAENAKNFVFKLCLKILTVLTAGIKSVLPASLHQKMM